MGLDPRHALILRFKKCFSLIVLLGAVASFTDSRVRAQSSSPNAARGFCGGVTVNATNMAMAEALFQAQGADFQIVATFGPEVTPGQRVVIEYAVNEWSAILQSPGVNPANYPVAFYFIRPEWDDLAKTIPYTTQNGRLHHADVLISTQYEWYEDPDPNTDSEFGVDPLPTGFDLLTIVRHEIGHAVGWIGADQPRIATLVADNVFDASRLNISLAPDDTGHANSQDHADELMQPTFAESTRLSIRLYPTVALVSRAFEYQIPMQFVDPAGPESQLGTAWAPWRLLRTANTLSPPGYPLLLAPTIHHVPVGQNLDSAHSLLSARGGAAIIAP